MEKNLSDFNLHVPIQVGLQKGIILLFRIIYFANTTIFSFILRCHYVYQLCIQNFEGNEEERAWPSGLRRWCCSLEVPGSSPPPCH